MGSVTGYTSLISPMKQSQKLIGTRWVNQVTNLANASSLIFNSLQAFPTYFGTDENKAVNWCGFYVISHLFPVPRGTTAPESTNDHKKLLLGPFCGKPACQFINVHPKPRGVCADAFNQRRTLVVPEVDLYPGHIACDGETKSELVCPLIIQHEDGTDETIGVLDLDCLAVGGFDADDEIGLNKISKLVVSACDW
ncbi:hypothetical protein D9615_004736 [Tricholomella constricta]|uniref:Free methionine-R-sulfoxide reductase n=1 Tax=Tricholomella constricta TaxID=117010 RepID=A0A8H5HBM8_9AGAR|nr:hypothetical protein D9615_004736 [Tricholomella constricta]